MAKSVIKKIIKVIFIIAAIYLYMIAPRIFNGADMSAMYGYSYAHRGLYNEQGGLPENTLSAFAKAIEGGYGIELDIQLTKDNVVVVSHDFDLNRACGVNKQIADLTYDEIAEYGLYGTEETVPTLEQVLSLVDGRVPLIIEYKLPGTDTKLCQLGNDILSKYDGAYCIQSFNPMAVFWYRLHATDVPRGVISDSYNKEGYSDFPWLAYEVVHNMLLNFLLRPDFISYDIKYPNDLSLSICRDVYGATTLGWTVTSFDEHESASNYFDMLIFEGYEP